MKPLLESALARSIRYLEALPERRVAPAPEALAALADFEQDLPAGPTDPELVLAELDRLGSPATVASAGGRYFGFVEGGSLPATTAATWLASAWDQNVALEVLSPVGARLEEVCLRWLLDLLGLPAGTGVGFVNGASQANFTALAAARHAVLTRKGWNVEARGLFGAPEPLVVVSEEVHMTVLKGLSLLGLGHERLIRVPADNQGRMRVDALPPLDASTIVCAQAGNVNTGATDPLAAIAARTRAAGAWLHIDGAFGLWAAAAPARRHLVAGMELADSWAVDAHKWLNTPYDGAMALVRDPVALRAAMGFSAANASYLQTGVRREPSHHSPELSRRARGVEIWAALRSLGRSACKTRSSATARCGAAVRSGKDAR